MSCNVMQCNAMQGNAMHVCMYVCRYGYNHINIYIYEIYIYTSIENRKPTADQKLGHSEAAKRLGQTIDLTTTK